MSYVHIRQNRVRLDFRPSPCPSVQVKSKHRIQFWKSCLFCLRVQRFYKLKPLFYLFRLILMVFRLIFFLPNFLDFTVVDSSKLCWELRELFVLQCMYIRLSWFLVPKWQSFNLRYLESVMLFLPNFAHFKLIFFHASQSRSPLKIINILAK